MRLTMSRVTHHICCAGFRLDVELRKLKEVQVQVQAAELLLRDKQQIADLLDMVSKQAGVIEQLQGQVQVEERFRARYLSVREGEALQRGDDEAANNTDGLDQLRLQLETELGALSTINVQFYNWFSRNPTAQHRQLAGPLPNNQTISRLA